MASARPTSVTVIAILNIILGSLQLLAGLCLGLMVLFLGWLVGQIPQNDPGGRAFHEMIDLFKNRLPRYIIAYYVLSLVVALLMGLWLLVSGIGLLKMQPSARTATLVFAVFSIVWHVADIGVHLFVVYPAMRDAMHDAVTDMQKQVPPPQRARGFAPPPGAPMSNPVLDNLTTVVQTLIGLAHAVAILIVLTRPHVVSAFAGSFSDLNAPRGDTEDRYRRDDASDYYRPDDYPPDTYRPS